MATIKETRLENLRSLVAEFRTADAVAQRAATAPMYLSQILTGAKSSTGKARGIGDALARRLEAGCGKELGWMDRPHPPIGQSGARQVEQHAAGEKRLAPREQPFVHSLVSAYDGDDALPDDVVLVPESRIEFAGGDGRINYELVEHEEPATYRRSWFQKYGINPDRVKRFRVVGDSMEPMLFPRDTILVNLDETNVIDGRMYALRYGDQLRVKHVSRRIDGTLVLRSVNPSYKEEEIPPSVADEHITIIGRVRDRSGTGGL